jgi:hypothetical protein
MSMLEGITDRMPTTEQSNTKHHLASEIVVGQNQDLCDVERDIINGHNDRSYITGHYHESLQVRDICAHYW